MSTQIPELSPEWFTALDRQFAGLLQRLARQASSELLLAAALISRARREGSICLELTQIAGRPWPALEGSATPLFICPELEPWLEALRQSGVTGRPGEFKPLVLEDRGRLYLHRYWEYETELAQAIKGRAALPSLESDPVRAGASLARLFPQDTGEINWQKLAAFVALRRPFCVISGGPGTGKTHTVVAILALLLEQHPAARIAVCAPTGKAAARIEESLKKIPHSLACDEAVRRAIPDHATTIHRLLGTIPGSPYFKHNEARLLPVDVLVVDEASMVDLPLMAKLFRAVPIQARMLLLGDKDQLASVEPGSVLGDICKADPLNGYSPELAAAYSALTQVQLPVNPRAPALADSLVQLQKNYRFGEEGGIYRLSRAINQGKPVQALEILQPVRRGSPPPASSLPPNDSRPPGQVRWRELPSPRALPEALRISALDQYTPLFGAADAGEALNILGGFRVLSPLRHGPYGVEDLNSKIEELLLRASGVQRDAGWYRGRPVMITENNYHLKLFNGDIGIAWPGNGSGGLQVFFPGEGRLRPFHPLRLPRHETVFAMTVHKSQGSEFDRLLLLLPEQGSALLTRELVYTGLTRARQGAELWMNGPVFSNAVERTIDRSSGLREALWGAGLCSPPRTAYIANSP